MLKLTKPHHIPNILRKYPIGIQILFESRLSEWQNSIVSIYWLLESNLILRNKTLINYFLNLKKIIDQIIEQLQNQTSENSNEILNVECSPDVDQEVSPANVDDLGSDVQNESSEIIADLQTSEKAIDETSDNLKTIGSALEEETHIHVSANEATRAAVNIPATVSLIDEPQTIKPQAKNKLVWRRYYTFNFLFNYFSIQYNFKCESYWFDINNYLSLFKEVNELTKEINISIMF